MATAKRKAVTDERPNKKAKPSADGERRPVPKSVLQQEERAFPRGGGSVLTPLEHKQIKAQAEADVLFEQETGKGSDDEAAPRKKVKKSHRQKDDNVEKKTTTPIQGLSYKTLVVGSVVLGCVTAITGRDVEVALANNLSGYVPLTAVSAKVNTRIEALLEEDELEDEEADVELKNLFHVGQWLRAKVTSTSSESSKRHIELTVDPAQVNGGLDSSAVVVNSMLQASVRSVEDHGVVMDVGLADANVRGFIGKKDIAPVYKLDDLEEGQVLLCLVTGKGKNSGVINLSPNASPRASIAEGKPSPSVSEAPTVDAFQAGTAVDVLITDAGPNGVHAKIMGLVDVTADIVHSGSASEIAKAFKIGSKHKARITWTIPASDESRRVGVSFLPHLLALPPPSDRLPDNASATLRALAAPGQSTPSTIAEAKVSRVLPDRGLFLSIADSTAFAHISQLSDSHLAAIDEKYAVGSVHRSRMLAFNPIDRVSYVTLKPSIIEQPFLRIEDVKVGEVVSGTIERLILGAKGVSGILIKLSDSISGLAPAAHFSDVPLSHPEKRFKEGAKVKARVLSVDTDRRRIKLTLKKSLVNDDSGMPIWSKYDNLEPGMESKGTVVNLLRAGAAVQFFGEVRAWLPVGEMSETFIEDPEKHFRIGQTIDVRILSVDKNKKEMKVTCRDSASFSAEQQAAWEEAKPGLIVAGTITEKSSENVMVELDNGLKGLIRIGHLSDTVPIDPEKVLKKMHVDRKLSDLVVLHKLERSHHLVLSRKKSLVADANANSIVTQYQDVHVGAKVNGFVRNITPDGVYVEFAGGVVGLMSKTQLLPTILSERAFGLRKDQSITCWVISVDAARERFSLTMREEAVNATAPTTPSTTIKTFANLPPLQNPVDPSITDLADLSMGKIIKVRIAGIKANQLNVRVADKVPGRIDVSELFDSWDEIADKKVPLKQFKVGEVLDAKILGMHDSRGHRFLPITHRSSGVTSVFEMSAKKSRVVEDDESGLKMSDLQKGAKTIAFINNHSDDCLWANASPNVRGRIALLDLSEDAGQLQDLAKNFPVGCAVEAHVKHVDAAANKLDLSGRTPLDLASLEVGMLLPARVTKINDASVAVQLSDTLSSIIPMAELSDDYDDVRAALERLRKNEIVRVCVVGLDKANKRVWTTMRPSKTLSSSLPVKDRQVASIADLKKGEVVRGFVKRVAEKGVYVSLGARTDASVRVSDLSDKFVKDWQAIVQVDQLVTGRVLAVDADAGLIRMTLKQSQVDSDYTPPLTISELTPGQIVTGKVRKVEDFGAFIDIDNTQPRLSGLCHRSEVAARRVEDVRKLFTEGDQVKAKVLSVDVNARKFSLGLKASYFANADEDDRSEEGEEREGVELEDEEELDAGVDEAEGGVDLGVVMAMESADEDMNEASSEDDDDRDAKPATAGLKTNGFDWTGDSLEQAADVGASDSEADKQPTKKRKRKPEIKVDMTGDLDKHGSRSVSDFERLLLGQPNDSGLWIQYMAFQLQLSEVQKARDIAARALRTIHIRELDEKANIWIAWLNLEVEYGDDEKVEEVFGEACKVQDPMEMHGKLASIYIDSGRHDKAHAVFERMVGNKAFRASPELWLNYGSFLMDKAKAPQNARALLSRALQSVAVSEHRLLTAKFAAMEFRSEHGDAERGRTIFEGLITEWPKWSSGWDMFVDLERAKFAQANSKEEQAEAAGKVRALFERMAAGKMKKRRARFVFKRWLAFEEEMGDAKGVERVKGLAKEYVEGLQNGDGDE